jgi:myosin heavy subunit
MKWNWWDLIFRGSEVIKEIERKEKELNDKEKEIKKAIKQLKEKEETINKKEKELKEKLVEQEEELKEERKKLDEEKKKLDEERKNIAKEREQIFRMLQLVYKQLEEIRKQRDELAKEKKEYKENLKKKFREKLNKIKDKFKQQVKKQKGKFQKRIQKLLSEIEKLQRKIIELEQEKGSVFISTADVPVKIIINSQNTAKTQIEFYVHADYVGLIREEIQQDIWGTEYMPTSDGFVWKFRIRTDAPKKKKKEEDKKEENKKVEGEGGEEVDMSETKALLQTEPDYKWFHVLRWLEDYRVEMTEEQYSLVSVVSGVAGWKLDKLFGQRYTIRYICSSARLSGFAEVSVYVGNEALEESQNEEREESE